MKTDKNVMIIGGVVIAAVVIYLLWKTSSPGGTNALTDQVKRLFGGDAPPLTPGDEVEQAAMYGHYY